MRIVILLLISVLFSASYGQSDGRSVASTQVQEIPLVFDQQEFGDRFSVLFASDDQYDYYVIDLTKLRDRFGKVYFMNLTYSESKIVNLDGDMEKDQTWFKSYFKFTEEEITCLFNDLKEKTDRASLGMKAEEKSAWMGQFDKFKKSNKNE